MPTGERLALFMLLSLVWALCIFVLAPAAFMLLLRSFRFFAGVFDIEWH